VPCPYARLIVGTRHCRLLISGNINSDATEIDITTRLFVKKTGFGTLTRKSYFIHDFFFALTYQIYPILAT
jgi:hypothetical protein